MLLSLQHIKHRQQGATLAISLIILLMLTLVGIASINSSLFQQKMSGNTRDKERSFEASEAALAEAEDWLLSQTSVPTTATTCSSQPCVLSNDPNRYPEFQNLSWWSGNSAVISNTLPKVSTQPKYVIEYERFVADDATIGAGYPTGGVHYYRVTTRGTGHTDSAKTVLQATVGKRY